MALTQCEDRLNSTPQTELTWQEGLPWRASARPSWRRLTRPKGTAAATHGPGSADAESPRHRWRLRGSVAAAQEEQLVDMSRQGRRIIPELTIPARPLCSHRQPARHSHSARVQDQLASITIFQYAFDWLAIDFMRMQ